MRLRSGCDCGKVVARETVGALRKDVTANATAAISLANASSSKSKGGQKRMKSFGSVNIPQEAFIEVLKA